jgi:hypothetical protein
VYGDEHIDEFNRLFKRITYLNPNIKVLVGTNEPNKIIGVHDIIHIEDDFNYNLKRLVIKEGLKDNDVVLYLDTDIIIRDKIDFTILETLPKGFHPFELGYPNQYLSEYLNELKQIYPKLSNSISEHGFVIVKDYTTNMFIDTWELMDNRTKSVQSEHYGMKGAQEGLLMWISANIANTTIHDPNGLIQRLSKDIIHFGKPKQKYNTTIV